MNYGDTHRELFFGAAAVSDDPKALSQLIQDHVAQAESTEAAMADLMLTVGRLATTLRQLASVYEEEHPGWSFIEAMRRTALKEEIDGG